MEIFAGGHIFGLAVACLHWLDLPASACCSVVESCNPPPRISLEPSPGACGQTNPLWLAWLFFRVQGFGDVLLFGCWRPGEGRAGVVCLSFAEVNGGIFSVVLFTLLGMLCRHRQDGDDDDTQSVLNPGEFNFCDEDDVCPEICESSNFYFHAVK